MTPSQIRAARLKTGLTQEQAAGICWVAMRTFQDWERGIAKAPEAAIRVFLHRTGQGEIPVDHSIYP